jgi:uncharacterized protein (UPF0333 family)
MKKPSFRAQISLEFIIILAIALSFIILWIPAIVTTQNSTQSAIDKYYLEKAAEDVSYSSDVICILGEGNERELYLVASKNLSITSNLSRSFTISDFTSNTSMITQTKCKMNISATIGKGRTRLVLENEKEIITIKQK